MNEVLQQIQKCMSERNWTLYKLSKECDIPYSSLSSLFAKNNQPTISTLEKICDGFNITLSEFFSYKPPYRNSSQMYTESDKELIIKTNQLNKKDQQLLLQFIDLLISHEK